MSLKKGWGGRENQHSAASFKEWQSWRWQILTNVINCCTHLCCGEMPNKHDQSQASSSSLSWWSLTLTFRATTFVTFNVLAENGIQSTHLSKSTAAFHENGWNLHHQSHYSSRFWRPQMTREVNCRFRNFVFTTSEFGTVMKRWIFYHRCHLSAGPPGVQSYFRLVRKPRNLSRAPEYPLANTLLPTWKSFLWSAVTTTSSNLRD